MAVSGGMKCAKYLLFSFNFLFFLAGIILVICGALVQTRFKDYFEFFGGQVNAAAIVLIVVGVIILVVGFFGCCGALKESKYMVVTFAVLLVIIIIVEVAAAITAFYMRSQITETLTNEMEKAMHNYGKNESYGVTQAWDRLQENFKCCGAINSSDWIYNQYITKDSVPDSCCIDNHIGCGAGMAIPADPKKIYTEGCLPKFIDWVRTNIAIVGGVAAGIALLQVLGLIISCCLSKAIEKQYETV